MGREQVRPSHRNPTPPFTRQLTEPEIYRGTGAFTGGPPATEPVVVAESGDIALNFANADVREVIDAVLGNTLGLNYFVHPRVTGTVTMRTSRPVARDDVVPILEMVLAPIGFAIDLSDGTYRILPIEEAATNPSSPLLSVAGQTSNRHFGIHFMPLRYASARTLHEVLQPFISPGRTLVADPSRQLLIFVGTGPEAGDLANMVETFDVDWLEGMSFALLPVETASPDTLAAELEVVFGQDVDGPLADLIRFVPIERMDAILVVTARPDYVDRAREWANRLDRGEDTQKRTFVYHLQHGRAANVAAILSELVQTGQSAVRPGEQLPLAPGRTPVEIRSAEREDMEDGGNVVMVDSEARRRQGRSDLLLTGATDQVERAGTIRIIADEETNSLIIHATAEEYRTLEKTIRQLDPLPLQILVEATIAEITLNDRLRYGVEWFFQSGGSGVFSVVENIVNNAPPVAPGLSVLIEGANWRAVLHALSGVTNVKVISAPQLLVLENQTARLQVGDQVPVPVQQAVSVTDPAAPIVNSIVFRDTGVILEITPRVNSSGLVMLDVVQQVSDAVPTTTSGISAPTIQERSVASKVAVQGGETIVLGGLIRDRQEKREDGVPLLSQVPVLGNLFKVTSDDTQRTELLVLITPHILRNAHEVREATRALRERMSGLGPLEYRVRGAK